MVRIVIDIEDHGGPMVTKETVAANNGAPAKSADFVGRGAAAE